MPPSYLIDCFIPRGQVDAHYDGVRAGTDTRRRGRKRARASECPSIVHAGPFRETQGTEEQRAVCSMAAVMRMALRANQATRNVPSRRRRTVRQGDSHRYPAKRSSFRYLKPDPPAPTVTVRIRPVGRWLLPHLSWAIWAPTCRRALLDDLAVSNARFQRIGKELQRLREIGTVARDPERNADRLRCDTLRDLVRRSCFWLPRRRMTMLTKITLALALAIAASAVPAYVGSSYAQSNPNFDCSPYRGESMC
jgi:hypothetical protein